MKILFLTNNIDLPGGWGRYSYELISRVLDRPGMEGKILVEEKGENSFLKKRSEKFIFSKNILVDALRMRPYLKQCQIIHCFDAYPYAPVVALANLGLNKKLIINLVGSYSVAPLDQWPKKYLMAFGFRRADKILAMSHYVLREVEKRVKIKNSDIMLYGVDSNKFYPPANKAFDQNPKKIITISTVKARKGYHLSLAALAKVKKQYSNFKYYIIGYQGAKRYVDYLKKMARENNLEENVVFLQNVSEEELLRHYHEAYLYLMPSVNGKNHFEGFGSVYLEANACGLPVIGSRDCGTEDAIRDGYNGFLVVQKDIDELADRILRLLKNRHLAEQMGKNGRKFAEEMSWDKVVDKFIKTYRELLPPA